MFDLHLESRAWIHITSAVGKVRPLYSDSVLDLETIDCFLENQDTRLEPRYIAYPATDFLSSLSYAHSA